MSTLETDTPTSERGSLALRWWSLGAFVALLTLAGGLLWWRFGSVIFVDLLASLQACF